MLLREWTRQEYQVKWPLSVGEFVSNQVLPVVKLLIFAFPSFFFSSLCFTGKIQLRKECVEIFNDLYEFDARGKVYVKGKDMMEVCLFKSKKEETLEVFIEHHPNVI